VSERGPTLSPSKITTYLACPVKFRWTYVDARGRWYLRSKSYYSFGTTLHRVLERFYDSNETGVSTTAEVLAAYDESWIDAGFSSAEEMQEAYGEGVEILERHVAETMVKPKIANTVYIERLFTHKMRGFKLVGRVDRVDEHPDGTLEIIDYKTGRDSVREEDVSTDIAMAIYQFLVKQKHPEQRVMATIVALKTGHSASWEMPAGEMEQFERDIQALGDEILNEEYHELTPKFKVICPHCDFIPLCRKHEDFVED
jgi:putative RecB family exonuclease